MYFLSADSIHIVIGAGKCITILERGIGRIGTWRSQGKGIREGAIPTF